MGKLTCTVMLGFLSLHVTVILMMLATGTPEWLTSSHNATADRGNATYPDRSKGLWKVCSGDNCTKVDESEQPSEFKIHRHHNITHIQITIFYLDKTVLI